MVLTRFAVGVFVDDESLCDDGKLRLGFTSWKEKGSAVSLSGLVQLPPPKEHDALLLPNEAADESEKLEQADRGRSIGLPQTSFIMYHSLDSELSVLYAVSCDAGVRGGDSSRR